MNGNMYITVRVVDESSCRWSKIAARLPGRTDNEIKNVWHTHLKKRLQPKEPNATPSPKKTSSCDSSLSSAGSSLSSFNQCGETQLKEKQTDMDHIPGLGVGKVSRPDHGQTDENEKCALISDEQAIEIPVEPDQLDLTREMLDEGSSSSSGEEIFNKQMAEFANSSSERHRETESSIRHSPSFSSTSTLNSCGTISPNTGQFHLMMNSSTVLDGYDVWKDMNEWSDESNFADMIWDSLDDDLRSSFAQPSICPKSSTEPYDPQNSSTVKGGESKEAVGGQWWLLELENKLELSSASGEHGEYKSYLVKGDLVLDKPKSDSSNLSSSEEIVLEFEVDPIVAYFQSLSSSPTFHL